MNKSLVAQSVALSMVLGGGMFVSAQAGMVKDGHGNVGYDTAAECDAAVASGKAKFYQSFTHKPPLQRAGETGVKKMTLADLVAADKAAKMLGYNAADYAKGACDIGVGHSNNRDGVSPALIGKYVPYAPSMSVNAYTDSQGQIVRATMQQCDNNFSNNMPRPIAPAAAPVAAQSVECFADVLTPAKFETKTEQVVKVPATKRYEAVPATYKTMTEQVVATPEMRKQIPVPATYKTITEEVVVRPASTREEPVPPTFKTVTEQIVAKAESKRIEVIPATYKTVTERVMVSPEKKTLKVIPAVYGEKEEVVPDRAPSTTVQTVPGTYKTVSERVLAKPESLRYEPVTIPMKTVTEDVLRAQASQQLQAVQPTYRTVTERVEIKAASKRLVELPATYETITERVKVQEASRVWKRGRAWVGQAINVRPLRSFVVDGTGKVDGASVDSGVTTANNNNLDDDVMCLVEVPERYETITRQVVKMPATVREEVIPAEYGTVTRTVLDQPATTKTVDIPASYQKVTRQVIDIDKLKAAGYKFDDEGDIVAGPNGDRILRASAINGKSATAGAASGTEGYVREVKIPAEYKEVTRQVIDRPATVQQVTVPGTTKVVKTQVLVTPARTEEIVTPAVYKDVTRQVVDKPASQREIPIPAEYKTVSKQVIDRPASTRTIPIPEVKEKIERRVIDTPASVKEEIIPAVYKTISRQVIDQPASTREIVVPAQYETMTYQVKVSEAKLDRRSVLCETNATPEKIKEIQQALDKAGFNPGPINGVLRQQTMTAVNKFQQSKGLPVDGFLNLDTVRALGVSPN